MPPPTIIARSDIRCCCKSGAGWPSRRLLAPVRHLEHSPIAESVASRLPDRLSATRINRRIVWARPWCRHVPPQCAAGCALPLSELAG